MYRKLLLMVVLLVLFVPEESNASVIQMFRKLVERDNRREKTVMSPSPSPFPSMRNFGHVSSGDDRASIDTDERCDMLSNSCKDNNKNMTACLRRADSDSQGSFLLIQNDGEIFLKVNFTILPVNFTCEEIELLEHHAKKMDISAHIGGSHAIVLSAGNGGCTIHMGSSVPETFYKLPYATYATPINGAYLLFLTALIIGGTWACCKLGRRGRNLEGVPYQELEMGHPDSLSAMNVETAEGWDHDWDEDDWDEEVTVKSSNENHVGNGQANGFTSRASKSDGWGNDWDD